MKIILIGPPGVGKGTQSKLICEKFDVVHISTGNILRKHIKDETNIGKIAVEFDIEKGKFVSDNLANSLIQEVYEDGILNTSYLLDGYPRTLPQAKFYYDNFVKDTREHIVIYLNADRNYIVDRVSGRRVCINCGETYNLLNNPPKIEGICDVCSSDLIQREDDYPLVFKRRLEIYDEITIPIINYFIGLKFLFEVDASKGINDIFSMVSKIIGEYYDLY